MTGDNWKLIIFESFEKEIEELNSPNSKRLVTLYKKYLNLDLELFLCWKGMSFEKICRKLDLVITLRGDVVHRSKKLFETKSIIDQKRMSDYINFISKISTLLEEIKQ